MPPKTSQQYRDFGTKDAPPDVPRFNRSASKWKKADLDLLGIEYHYRVYDDIQFGVDADMPSGLLESTIIHLLDGLTFSRRKICPSNRES